MMENAVMVGVLLAVVGVGLFGLYYAQSPTDAGTIYVPRVTGMGTISEETTPTFSIDDNTGGDVSNIAFTGSGQVADPINPTLIDSFGNTYGTWASWSTNYSATPVDPAYWGNTSNNFTLCAWVEHQGTTYMDVSAKMNSTLPSGFNYQKVTVAPYNSTSWPTGTSPLYNDTLANGSFDDGNSLTLTAAYQDILTNWSNGTGTAGTGIYPRASVACKWSFDPYVVQSGTFQFPTAFTWTAT